MKLKVSCVIFLLCLATAARAENKEYTILGNQKIKAKVLDERPLPAEKGGITIQGAGFVAGKGHLIWTFDFASKKPPVRVVVENVTGKQALILVEDPAPQLRGDRWNGQALPVPLTKSGSPWLYQPGDTTMVFRFTITLKGRKDPVVIYQPAVYPQSTKQDLLQSNR